MKLIGSLSSLDLGEEAQPRKAWMTGEQGLSDDLGTLTGAVD